MILCCLNMKTFFYLFMIISSVKSFIHSASYHRTLFYVANSCNKWTCRIISSNTGSSYALKLSLRNKNEPESAVDTSDNADIEDAFDEVSSQGGVPLFLGSIIFVYSIYFIYLALFTDEALDPRIPLAL